MSGTAREGKVLMVGPVGLPGNYVGGIGVLLAQIQQGWNLPYELAIYNTEVFKRDYGTTNQVNLTNLRRLGRNALDLLRIVREERPAVVHFHTSRDLALIKDLTLAFVLRLAGRCQMLGHVHHASYQTLLFGKHEWLRRIQLRLLTLVFDRLVLMSENIREDLASRLNARMRRRFEQRAVVLYNFTRLPKIGAAPAGTHHPLNIFYIGNVGRAKGIFELIAAVAQLSRAQIRNVRLILAGPFDSAAEGVKIRQAIETAGLARCVELTGTVAAERKDALFREADIFVLPSYAEGVPLSMLEAMSYRLPVVATVVGGIPEILHDGQAGILVQPGDVEGLCAALTRLLECAELRSEMGRRGRMRVEARHTAEHFMLQLDAIYESLVGRTALARAHTTAGAPRF